MMEMTEWFESCINQARRILSTLDLSTLPSKSIDGEDFAEGLPTITAVYFVFAPDRKRPIYIGRRNQPLSAVGTALVRRSLLARERTPQVAASASSQGRDSQVDGGSQGIPGHCRDTADPALQAEVEQSSGCSSRSSSSRAVDCTQRDESFTRARNLLFRALSWPGGPPID